MPFPQPIPGQVIRYAYLWRSEFLRGQEEGVKDRPCAVVLMETTEEGNQVVTVLPVTHTPSSNPDLAIEIPHAVKRRLQGLFANASTSLAGELIAERRAAAAEESGAR